MAGRGVQGETVHHQRAKRAIAEGCVRAGFTPQPEAVGEGWRADVLALPPGGRGVRIAFEVQWSFLRLPECEARQRRYAADGVRGCWFFRQPPRRLANQAEGVDALRARHDLPLFRLWGALDASFQVALNDRLFALEAFVERLLLRRLRFCAHAAPAHAQAVRAAWLETSCPGCGRPLALAHVQPALQARCGLRYPSPVPWWSTSLARHPAVLAALPAHAHAAALQSEGWCCARCGLLLRPYDVDMALLGTRAAETAHALGGVVIPLPAVDLPPAPMPHWCTGGEAGFCAGEPAGNWT